MGVIEYFRTPQGFMRREIEPMFTVVKVNCGSRYEVGEMRRLKQNREIPGMRHPAELPENLRNLLSPLS